MRLPRTNAVLSPSVPAQPDKILKERSKSHPYSRQPRQLGIRPQGCCRANICAPIVGCHCLGIESPFC
jgi:hypothetical protein